VKGAGTHRDSAGRFEVHARCEFCGLAIRGDYWSDPDLDSLGGLGQYLCARVRCRAKREALPTEERAEVYRARDKARQIIRAAMRDTVRDAAEADRMMGNRLGEPLRSLVELQRTNPVSPTELRRRILEEMRAVRRRIR